MGTRRRALAAAGYLCAGLAGIWVGGQVGLLSCTCDPGRDEVSTSTVKND